MIPFPKLRNYLLVFLLGVLVAGIGWQRTFLLVLIAVIIGCLLSVVIQSLQGLHDHGGTYHG